MAKKMTVLLLPLYVLISLGIVLLVLGILSVMTPMGLMPQILLQTAVFFVVIVAITMVCIVVLIILRENLKA
jgi:hypothetical protein